jgi:DNA polymerase sigma
MATLRVVHSARPAKPARPARAHQCRTPKRKRPDRSWRIPAPHMLRRLWHNGQPTTFTREELAERWLFVKEIERTEGRRSPDAQLARAIHAVHRRQSRAAEAWLRRQLDTLEPQP